jgi:hypothetical protein
MPLSVVMERVMQEKEQRKRRVLVLLQKRD